MLIETSDVVLYTEILASRSLGDREIHRSTQMDPTRPNPLSKEKSRPDPTRPVDGPDPCSTLFCSPVISYSETNEADFDKNTSH